MPVQKPMKVTDMQSQQERIARFEQAARAIDEKIGELGLSEEALMEHIERTRQRLFEERQDMTRPSE